MKLIFKKKGAQEFVGRYHDKFPISAKNPITNAVSFQPLKSIENYRWSAVFHCSQQEKG